MAATTAANAGGEARHHVGPGSWYRDRASLLYVAECLLQIFHSRGAAARLGRGTRGPSARRARGLGLVPPGPRRAARSSDPETPRRAAPVGPGPDDPTTRAAAGECPPVGAGPGG